MTTQNKTSTYGNQKSSQLRAKSTWYASCKGPFMDLSKASRLCNIQFDQVIISFYFGKSLDEFYVYKKIEDGKVVFLVPYKDNILLIENNKKMSLKVKCWLLKQFDMKDLEKANYILKVKLRRDQKNKILASS